MKLLYSRWILLLCSVNAAIAGGMPSLAANTPILALYDAQINQKSVGEGRFLRMPNGSLYLNESDLASWHLRRPEADEIKFDGQVWLPLNNLAGANFKVNDAKQAIQIELSAKAFVANTLETESIPYVKPMPPSLGGFINYDLLGSGANGLQQLNGTFEANFFGSYGILSSSCVGQNLVSATQQPRHLIRQDTVWSRDWPDQMVNVQVGDTQGRGGLWGRPIYFGGVRWGRNFATQPGFVSSPTPSLAGEAVLPSTVDLYIDGVMRKHLDIPPGPFSLGDFPQVTGQGEAKLIVRDNLGREQVIIAPYAATGALLKQGVVDYSFEAGFIRKNYGLNSNDYGDFMTAATIRKGWSERLTVEGRGEALRNQQSFGLGGSILTGLGVATAAVVASHSDTGRGTLGMLSLDKQTANLNFGLRGQVSSADFVQIGGVAGALKASRTLSANLGWQLGMGRTLGASYAQREMLNQPANKVASLSYGMQLGAGFSLNASLLTILSEPKNNSLMFFLIKPINNKGASAMLSGNVQNQHVEQPTLQLQQAAWRNGDLGYKALWVGGNINPRKEAGVTLRSQRAIYSADASHVQTVTNYRVGVQGGLAMLEGQVFATQRINDSFGLVRVPGYSNVEISSNYQVVARTNSKGDAIVPDLFSYRNNMVGVSAQSLPMDAQLSSNTATLVPYYRNGLSTTFAVKRSRSVLLTLMLEDGKPAPVGMDVSVEGLSETFMVGMRGEAFVTDLSDKNKLQATWRGKSCKFDYALPAEANATVYSEPIICKDVQR